MELRNWRLFRVHQLHIKLGSGGNPLVGQQTWPYLKKNFVSSLYFVFSKSLDFRVFTSSDRQERRFDPMKTFVGDPDRSRVPLQRNARQNVSK